MAEDGYTDSGGYSIVSLERRDIRQHFQPAGRVPDCRDAAVSRALDSYRLQAVVYAQCARCERPKSRHGGSERERSANGVGRTMDAVSDVTMALLAPWKGSDGSSLAGLLSVFNTSMALLLSSRNGLVNILLMAAV